MAVQFTRTFEGRLKAQKGLANNFLYGCNKDLHDWTWKAINQNYTLAVQFPRSFEGRLKAQKGLANKYKGGTR